MARRLPYSEMYGIDVDELEAELYQLSLRFKCATPENRRLIEIRINSLQRSLDYALDQGGSDE